MAVKPIPDGYHTITPYLSVEGAHRLMDFLKRAFDGEQTELMTAPDGTIKHAEMKLGDSRVMLTEACEENPPRPGSFYLYVPDTDATYQRALDAGATSLMEPADQFYGDRNAGVQDPVGNKWWIATHFEDISPEELQRRAREAGK
jgi:PhnB protein